MTLILHGTDGITWPDSSGPTAAEPGGGLVLLGSASANNSTSIDIGSGLDLDATIDGTYDVYELHCVGVAPAADGAVPWLRVSTDTGSTFKEGASDYFAGAGATQNDTKIMISGSYQMGNVGAEAFTIMCRIFKPADAAILTGVEFYYNGPNSAGTPAWNTSAYGGGYGSAGAVDALRVLMDSGNITSGDFHLYGVTKA